MSQETDTVLQKSLDSIDAFRRRVYAAGWFMFVVTVGMYARFFYVQRTSDNLEGLLGASLAALTFVIAWTTFAVILTVVRMTKRVLRAIELLSNEPQRSR